MTVLVIAGAVLLGAFTVGFVLYPVMRAGSTPPSYVGDAEGGDHLAELLARRDAVYEAIRDAEFDRETGKLTAEDYQLMRQRLTAEGVRLLQELDRLMQSDVREELEQEIEAEVLALRRRQAPGGAPLAPDAATQVASDGQWVRCPACSSRVRANAQFCTHCGTSLALECPNCNARVRSEDRFCSRCGEKLSPLGEDVELGRATS
jgi:hypothetical protein